MPPFTRGRAFRGGCRSRGSTRGKGRGRGNIHSRNVEKTLFHTTRVEEQEGSDAGATRTSTGSERTGDESVEEPSSGSEDDKGTVPVAKPHNTLLQSLNANIQRGPPQRKKRRLAQDQPQSDITRQHGADETQQDLAAESGGDDREDVSVGRDVDSAEDAEDDPFLSHIADINATQFEQRIKDIEEDRWHTARSSSRPGLSCFSKVPLSASPADLAVSTFRCAGDFPVRQLLCQQLPSLNILQLKQRLKGPAIKLLGNVVTLRQDVSPSIFSYRDVLFSERTPSNADDIRKLSCIHLLNHLYKTRDRVIKNNARLAKEANEDDIEFRDQGFTRPKVLIILPTRKSCAKYVQILATLSEPDQQENKQRFQDSYTQGEDDLSQGKPQDFRELFDGNNDDMFRLGMKFTRKTIKYFSQFYSSDIIFASPLGMRMAIGAENEKRKEYDFLSSIEILVLDQADALSMQNWEHVEYLLEHLNLQPKEAHDCDFSRVRGWYLDGNAKYVRQTLLFSAFNFPALNRVYSNRMSNFEGKVKYSKVHEGAMLEIGISCKQTFSRFDCTSPATEPDERFNYFTTALVPILTKHLHRTGAGKQGVVVYLPSYADFVRVRNYLSSSSTTQNISFGSISEYTSVREVARARSHFFTGRHSVLLYTERAHHFRRYHLRGVKSVLMYGLPENPIFYKEIVGEFLGSGSTDPKKNGAEASVRSLFCKFDMLKLERIVGTKRVPSLLKEKSGDTFDFL